MVRIPVDEIGPFARRIFAAIGYPPDHAEIVVECLTEASLRGVDTHGLAKIPMYSRVVMSGKLPARADIKTVIDHQAMAVVDGGGGLGFVPAAMGMDLAIRKARRFGVGAVGIRHSSHFGMAGCYPLRAARVGMLGITFTNADRLIGPPGAAARVIGNNPIAFGAPCGERAPVLLDMSCSVASMGKVRAALEAGKKIPREWGFDQTGQPTDDPAALIDGGFQAPFGGHKGFGIALFMEIFSGVLTGGPFGKHAHAGLHYGGTKDDKVGHFMIAVDIEKFMPMAVFSRRIEQLVDEIKSYPTVPGGEIRYPGERAQREADQRRLTGIPFTEAQLRAIAELAGELGLECPASIAVCGQTSTP